jgi:SAM-dependent methyltransferase
VARGKPAVLADDEPIGLSKTLSVVVAPTVMADQRLDEPGYRDAVERTRLDVETAHLDRAEARMRPDVPPQVRVIEDRARAPTYQAMFRTLIDAIAPRPGETILEIGCGPGQLAAMLRDQGVRQYVGLDFSPTAVAMARKNVADFDFIVADARTSDVYDRVPHDTIICTEVLEHIEDDLLVVSHFRPGKRCLCTVPNFPFTSHVRHFRDEAQVIGRFGCFFDKCDVRTLMGTRSSNEVFFLLDGIRNVHTII